MAASTSNPDYFSGRPAIRTRPGPSALGPSVNAPRSPRTPQLGRSISSQFGSPGSFRVEQDDILVYELDPRHFSAGYAGESRPRCILPFTPDGARRVGDSRQYDPGYAASTREARLARDWAEGHELYTNDIRDLDLGLVEDKLDRVLRTAQVDYLQLDQKPKKAVLVVSSRLPTPLLQIALKVLFGHFTQPPSIAVLPSPIMCCVSAGLRNALVVEVGWEETTVTAVGEYKEVHQRRSVRAGKLLTQAMGKLMEDEIRAQGLQDGASAKASFAEAEDLTQRMAWCLPMDQTNSQAEEQPITLPIPGSHPPQTFTTPFTTLAQPANHALFATASPSSTHDDHDLPLHHLIFHTLLALPSDLRASCLTRLILTGSSSNLPGLKSRLLQEITHLIAARGWDPVANYGSAQQALKERSVNIGTRPRTPAAAAGSLPTKLPPQEHLPPAERLHDDVKEPLSLKAERGCAKAEIFPGALRGVETLGAWAGASMMAGLRVRGVWEVDREEFLKNGMSRGLEGL